MSPFLIPGTEVSEKLNGVHGFMVEKNIKSQNIPVRKEKLKDKTFSSGATSLTIDSVATIGRKSTLKKIKVNLFFPRETEFQFTLSFMQPQSFSNFRTFDKW